MRPRMCHLGGAIADAVLLNWMLPAQAAQARRWVRQGADQAGRVAPIVASYVRVAVGPGARQRLRDEEGRYRNINEAHRQHFEAMDVPLGSVGVAASARPEVLDGLAPYHVRARPSDRTAARRPGRNLAARRRGCRGAVTRRATPDPLNRGHVKATGATRYRSELIGADQSARSGRLRPARSRRVQDGGLGSCWW